MIAMLDNWADELVHNKMIDYYYGQIKDWYTPKNESSILIYKQTKDFYILHEPTEQIDYE